ncbi:MAG: hypothetical protein RR197_03515 [Oscillospiraceae bacterium]
MSGDNKHAGGWLARILSKDQRAGAVVVLGMTGMALIVLSGLLGNHKAAAPAAGETMTARQYTTATEQRLETLLSGIGGVGRARVMVTLENGVEMVYAKDEKQSADKTMSYENASPAKVQEKTDAQQSYILVDSIGGKRQALVVTQLEPKIMGVVVVCPGAGSAVTRERVTDAVTTALGIRSIQVCVVPSVK